MKLIRRGKSSKAKKGSSVPLQSREKIAANVEGVVAGSNSRQVAPDHNIPLGAAGYASSRDEVFYEACPWLESDCEDEFFSINGDGTPARSFRTNSSSHTVLPPEPRKLPTLGAILKLKAEPPPSPTTTRLADLLRERQESFAHYDGPACVISRNGSSCAGGGEEGSHCCIPSFPRAVGVSYAGRRKRR
ncbi:hypothetical protein E2562_006904 [Oryza meyeriana var. granulata]|uniref:Uncharacterized protein n=1 Tax=Oryza meyeriana var. granulata TaxID=110450 RepID=A0A6G1BJF9_9ORYZ|nr:hypothetical protein E2562_006904 [Oryza meyeriana var. granulata]